MGWCPAGRVLLLFFAAFLLVRAGIVAGEWALGIILRHLDTSLIFRNFLIEVLTCLATSEGTCTYHVYK